MSPEPVRMKVYGLLHLTRTGYLRLQACVLVFLLLASGALMALGRWLRASGDASASEARGAPDAVDTSREMFAADWLVAIQWVVLAIVALELIETIVVLACFRRRAAERGSPDALRSTGSSSPPAPGDAPGIPEALEP